MMGFIAAALAGWAAYVVISPPPVRSLSERVTPHLLTRTSPTEAPATAAAIRHAGLPWSNDDLHLRRVAAVVIGATVGVLFGQGDLFLADPQASTPALVVLGALAGLLGLQMWLTSQAERRRQQAIHELPAICDTLALSVLSGTSLGMAIEELIAGSNGVVPSELADAYADYDAGMSLTEALYRAAKQPVHSSASRLYSLLGHAHQSGGRLSEALNELAHDFRADLQRSLTSEGGKKALAMYAPILALMVPVTLLFLIYPTLVSLQQLAGNP